MTHSPPPSLSRRSSLAALLLTTLSSCASLGGGASEAPPPIQATPEWRVGYTWRLINDARLIPAVRTTLETCVVGKTALLETAAIVPAGRGFDVVDRTSGARRLWMRIEDDPKYPASLTLNMNWVEGVGPDGRVRFLRMVDKVVKGRTALLTERGRRSAIHFLTASG